MNDRSEDSSSPAVVDIPLRRVDIAQMRFDYLRMRMWVWFWRRQCYYNAFEVLRHLFTARGYCRYVKSPGTLAGCSH